MPVINGVYLKDFTALPSSVTDANIIPIAITGNQIAYRTTVGGIVTDARVTSKLLTGLSVTGSAIAATDTILQAFGKVQNQINSKVSSVGLTMPSAFNVANSPITSAGTLAVTAAGVASQYIRGDGTLANFPTNGGGGGSVSYYLNGSVNQGTFGGNTYYEMSKVPIIGTGTDFTINANGYIAQFITDAADPALLNIPAGNWNFEMYFSASSNGGSPSFYIELYKYDGVVFTLISSSSATPEAITGGTFIDLYTTAVAVPSTSLTLTDRLAIRVYVTHSGRTITLHTENSHLCEVITTFSTGITALNGLTAQVQYFGVGTSGSDFNISSTTATHTFNLPTASATNRGALSSADWSTFDAKESLLTFSSPLVRTTNTISIPDATGSVNGYLTSTDWTTFNNKLSTATAASTYVPYTGATSDVVLGTNDLKSKSVYVEGDGAYTSGALFLKQYASGATNVIGYNIITTQTSGFLFSASQGGSFKNFILDASLLTDVTQRAYALPNASGTLALTSDLTGGTVTSVGLSAPTGFSVSGSPITTSGTLALSFASGYSLPTTVKQSNWDDAYTWVAAFPTQTGNSGKFLTTDGSTLSWAANPLGTVTSVAALTLGTSGTDLSSSVATGTTTPVITLNVPTASATNRGALSSADWTTFNAKQSALTNPVTYTGTPSTNYLPKFTGASTIGNSAITDDGTTVTLISRALSGTSATFSGILSATASDYHTLAVNDGSAQLRLQRLGSSAGLMYIGADNVGFKVFNSSFTPQLTIAATGAATFSSSVTAGGILTNGASGTAGQEAIRINNDNGYIGFFNSANSTRSGYLQGNTTDVTLATSLSVPLIFATNNTERMRITSGGDVIVKGTLADLTLGSSGAEIFFGRNSANYITANGGGGAEIRIISNTNGVVLANGGTSWGSLSDENSKDIIEPILNACDNLSQFRTIIGKYKTDDEDKRRLFLIAQDVEKAYPEAVFKIKNEEEEESLALNYQDLIPVLVKAIQELKAEIDLLKGIAPIEPEPIEEVEPIVPEVTTQIGPESEPKAEPIEPEVEPEVEPTEEEPEDKTESDAESEPNNNLE